MIVLHNKCNMCGRLQPAIEVEIPHATMAHRKSNGCSSNGLFCTGLCKDCVRAAVSAWALHGAESWSIEKSRRDTAKALLDAEDD